MFKKALFLNLFLFAFLAEASTYNFLIDDARVRSPAYEGFFKMRWLAFIEREFLHYSEILPKNELESINYFIESNAPLALKVNGVHFRSTDFTLMFQNAIKKESSLTVTILTDDVEWVSLLSKVFGVNLKQKSLVKGFYGVKWDFVSRNKYLVVANPQAKSVLEYKIAGGELELIASTFAGVPDLAVSACNSSHQFSRREEIEVARNWDLCFPEHGVQEAQFEPALRLVFEKILKNFNLQPGVMGLSGEHLRMVSYP